MLYLLPYSPFLNQSQLFFLKNLELKAACETEGQLTNAISSSFSELSASLCKSFYKKMFDYLKRFKKI